MKRQNMISRRKSLRVVVRTVVVYPGDEEIKIGPIAREGGKVDSSEIIDIAF